MDPLFIFMLSVWNVVVGITIAVTAAELVLPPAMVLAAGAVFPGDPLFLCCSAVGF